MILSQQSDGYGRRGMAWQGASSRTYGMARRGAAGVARIGTAGFGGARHGMAWHGRRGPARQGCAMSGVVWRGQASLGRAGEAVRPGGERSGAVRSG